MYFNTFSFTYLGFQARQAATTWRSNAAGRVLSQASRYSANVASCGVLYLGTYRAFPVLDGTAQVPTQIFRQVDFEIEGIEGTNAGSELAFFHLLSTVFPSLPFPSILPACHHDTTTPRHHDTTTPQQTHSVRQQPIDPAQRQTFLTESLDLSTLLLTTLYFFV